jgi:hypothetical protein
MNMPDPLRVRLDRPLARDAALKIVELLSLLRITEAGNAGGYRIARKLAEVAGIEQEIETRLSQIKPV